MHGRDENWSESLKGTDDSEDLSVGGRVMSEWISGKQGGKVWTGFIWLRIGTNGGEFLD
jgi:hypothetical protein